MDYIKNYKPEVKSVVQVRVLLVGPVGAGKSSFFNSINSVFKGHVTGQANTGSAGTSLTTQVQYCVCARMIVCGLKIQAGILKGNAATFHTIFIISSTISVSTYGKTACFYDLWLKR